MDADRAQNSRDPYEIFINTPEGQYGPSGYGEINFARWVNRKVGALFRRLRGRSTADRDHR